MKTITFVVLANGLMATHAAAALWDTSYSTPDLDFNATSFELTFKPNWASVADKCVSPQAFSQCEKNATEKAYDPCLTTCASKPTSDLAGSDPCQECTCTLSELQIDCAIRYCWNHVYGCEYQKTAMNAVISCLAAEDEDDDEDDNGDDNDDAAAQIDDDSSALDKAFGGVPYFPAPANQTDGACSCNMGLAWKAVETQLMGTVKCRQDDTSDDISQECGCCTYSATWDIYYQVCPNTSPHNVGIDWVLDYNLNNFTGESCLADFMSTADCKSRGFNQLPDGTYDFAGYDNLTAAAASATGALTNRPGQLSSLPGGSVATWTVNSDTLTVIATSATVVSSMALVTGGSSGTSNGGTASGTAFSTAAAGSASAGTTTSSTGIAATARADAGVGAMVLGLAAVVAHF